MAAYNSILNPDWFARLSANITAGVNDSIRATGSEADDPYWQARKGQQLGDLESARLEARKSALNQSYAMMGNAAASDAARQRVISAGLAINPQTNGSASYLGTQAPDVAGSYMPAPDATLPAAVQSPDAYVAPGSGGANPQRAAAAYRPYKYFDPGQFANDALERRKRALSARFANLTSQPVY